MLDGFGKTRNGGKITVAPVRWFRQARGYLSGLRHSGGRRDGIRVYSYHGVVERKTDERLERNLHLLSDFRAHLGFLRRFRVLSLTEVLEEAARPTGYRRAAAVITLDDGYANNLLACEVLAEFQMSGTVLVSTGVLGPQKVLWAVELALLFLHGDSSRVEALGQVWSLKSRAGRETAFQTVRYPIKSMPSALQRETLEGIREQFPAGETQRILREFPSLQMLSWRDLSQLGSAGIEIGSHGVDHEIHHADQPEAVRRRELTESKAELEARLGRPCRSFAFPNGDFVSASLSEVQEAGYALAFTTQQDTVTATTNRYLLPRLNPSTSLSRFAHGFLWEPAAAGPGQNDDSASSALRVKRRSSRP